MSGNTSATGGYLQPSSPPPIDGDALDQLLQEMVVGVTGLPPAMVRPRWQPTPPPQPAQNQDWASVGVTDKGTNGFPNIQHFSPGSPSPGYSVMYQRSWMTVVISFYGPNSDANAAILRDGLLISQNMETLAAQGIRITKPDDVKRVPELVNNLWVDRSDIIVMMTREVSRTYPIEDIVSAGGTVTTDAGNQSTFAAPPSGR